MSTHASHKKSCITPFMDQNINLNNINCFLTNNGGSLFNHPDFTPGAENLNFLRSVCRVLVIGAGGLGCEILKNLALLSFSNIDLIDMDTIELSNLNRQFLFRETDIGKSKAEVAASFIKKRRPDCLVTPYNNRIQDFDSKFYSKYHIVVCGLDSIIARRWINNMLVSLLKFDPEGNIDPSSIIPFIDGGTEGLKGNVRVIFPGITACLDCTLDLYPPQTTFPLCTIAHTPRLPEHCVEYVRMLQWDKDKPFGSDAAIDGDDPEHIKWIFEKSCERANAYNIKGVTLSLTQGVIRRIVPAVASTNAVIAAVCANEAFKIATSCFPPINNFLFNDTDGVYCYNYQTEKKEDCLVCGQNVRIIKATPLDHLNQIVDFLKEDSSYQMKSPGITAIIEGKRRTLYMEGTKQLEVLTRPNLDKSLKDLGLEHDTLIEVVDVTSPGSYSFRLSLVN